MRSVSAASVPTGVGRGTGSLSQTGSQVRQGRRGCWHSLVVVHPKKQFQNVVTGATSLCAASEFLIFVVCLLLFKTIQCVGEND